MRRVLLALALVAGCTKHNGNNAGVVCTPGEQRGCACIGGQTGVQICNAMGTGLGECFGCPGGPQLDLAGVDFSGIDFSGIDLTTFPPGTDLTGFNPDLAGADLSIPVEDMAMSMPDMAAPDDLRPLNDLSSTDLAGVTPCPTVMLVLDTSGSMGGPFTAESAVTHIAGAHAALDALVDNYGVRVPLGFAHFDESGATCNTGIVTSFEPMAGNQAALKNAINATIEGGATNTGDAINLIASDGNVHVPGAFIVMVTDGAGNCETTDPGFSVTAIDTAAKSSPSLKTYVIALDVAAMGVGDEGQMELMATDGQRPCSGGLREACVLSGARYRAPHQGARPGDERHREDRARLRRLCLFPVGRAVRIRHHLLRHGRLQEPQDRLRQLRYLRHRVRRRRHLLQRRLPLRRSGMPRRR